MSINHHQSASIRISQHQSALCSINQHQSAESRINKNQTELININQHQSTSICIHRWKFQYVMWNQNHEIYAAHYQMKIGSFKAGKCFLAKITCTYWKGPSQTLFEYHPCKNIWGQIDLEFYQINQITWCRWASRARFCQRGGHKIFSWIWIERVAVINQVGRSS